MAGRLGPAPEHGLRPACARVDLDRLAANYRSVAAAVSVPLMPVVKADAYGHGAPRVARALEALGAPLLAVAYPEEGVALRAAGVQAPVVVLDGFGPGQGTLLARHDLTPVVSTADTLEWTAAAAREAGRPLAVHLEVDTGMTRLGFATGAAAAAADRVADAGLRLEGVMTHLAAADEDPDRCRRQLDDFDVVVADLVRRGHEPRWVHAAASAGLDHVRSSHTLVRPGLLLYGLKPRPLSPALEVRPVLTLSARIALVREVPAGTPVSYGGRWVAQRPSRIGTLPLGYADGLPRTRAMSQVGRMHVAGRAVPVVGTVCMDLVMLDLTECPEVRAGDEAVVLGDAPTAWDVAEWAGTNAWQVLTAIGPRVPRVYVEGGSVTAAESAGR